MGALVIRALLLGVRIRAPDIGNFHIMDSKAIFGVDIGFYMGYGMGCTRGKKYKQDARPCDLPETLTLAQLGCPLVETGLRWRPTPYYNHIGVPDSGPKYH